MNAVTPELLMVPGGAARAASSVMDRALAEQAAHAGRMLEIAYTNGDREAALIWQRAMFDLVRLRQARRFGTDTQGEGANLGG